MYTSNPVLQQALVELSRFRVAGSAATWAIPYHIGTFSLMNPLGGDAGTEVLIRDLDPEELRRRVGENLGPVFGMDREDAGTPLRRLIMNPNYTPRGIAYIGLDLSLLSAVANLPMVLETLASADSPDEADVLCLELRLYSFFHRRVEPLREFLPFGGLFAAKGANGVFYFPIG